MNKTLTTEAGPTEQSSLSAEHIDTINQVFALFRVNFHNQYYAALNNAQVLNQTKKLWAESLAKFPSTTILAATKKIIEQSEYLPTLHKMLEHCRGDNGEYGLPDARQAYIEACHAGSPKTNHNWSHPAVYFAGRDSDWYFLASNTENQAFPIFKTYYEQWCEKVKQGETLPPIKLTALPADTATALDKKSNQQQLKKMREALKI